MQAGEIQAQSILVPSKLPDAEYVVNPYTGCAFGCQYCYASFMGRFVRQPVNAWGTTCTPRSTRSPCSPPNWTSSSAAAESLPHAELCHRSVPGCREAVSADARHSGSVGGEPYPGIVGILTKSPVVLGDVDLLAALPRAEVGLTVTTTDDRLGRFLEVRAPRASRRLAALRAHGIHTYAFVGPPLPHFRYEPAALDALFGVLARAGVSSIYVEHINLTSYIRQRLWRRLHAERREIQDVYRDARTLDHRRALDHLVAELLRTHGLTLRLSRVLYHRPDC